MSKLAAFLRRGAPAALAALLLLGAVPAAAEEAGAKVYAPELSFRSYTYSRWGDPIACPDPYTVEKVVTGVDLGVGDFKKPNDMFASAAGYLYIAASGDTAADNRVVKLDKNLQVVGSFSGYIDADGQTVAFKEPLGVFITAENDIYVADGTSKQIIHMDAAGKLKRIIAAPSSEDSAIIDADFVERYRPSKLVVDSSGRIHVVAINVNEGIVEFDPDGKFEGFLAAGKVNANPIEVIWKKLSTQAQLERMSDFVPIEYNNVSLDDEDFIFATSAAIDGKVVVSELRSGKGTEQGALVRRLNMLGKDILRRKGFGPPSGDREFVGDTDNIDSPYIGTSKFVDVANGPDGTYTVLDSTRSRLFTYDSEGYLLYAFGGPDVTAGGFRTPASLAQLDDCLYVLDSNTRAITMFRRTGFGDTVAEAIAWQEGGDYKKSAELWSEALTQNANYDMAYSGLGKASYRDGDYKEAMGLFKLGNNTDWYSRAYKEYRKTVVAKWFAPAAVAVAVLAVGILAAVKIRTKRKTGSWRGRRNDP